MNIVTNFLKTVYLTNKIIFLKIICNNVSTNRSTNTENYATTM